MDNHGTSPERHSASGPGILLVDTNRWPLAARLASGFLDLGGRVAAVCPVPGHPIRKVRGFERLFRYASRHPLESLLAAIEAFAPDIIIPLCDRSVQHLHDLHTKCSSEIEPDRRIRRLIERSLGPATSYPVVSSRYDLLMLAKDEGIRVPETARIDSVEDLNKWQKDPPWLLKADGTWGGRGVRRANSVPSGEEALLELTRRASVFELATQLIVNRDRDRTVANWQRTRPGVVAQCFVTGRPANCAVVSWQGEILAGIAVEVIRTDGPCRPASIVRVVEGREMIDAAKRIARRLSLSGFFGLDFVIEKGTGGTYLIEMNPRCTPPCSASFGEGRDLVAAIWAKLTNQLVHHRPPLTDKTTIAYFPQALLGCSDPAQITQLDSACLDIPDEEPELVHELLNPWSDRSLAGRVLDQLRRKFAPKKLTSEDAIEIAQSKDLDNADQGDTVQKLEQRQEQIITTGSGQQAVF
jgi:ATP-grasp domain